MVQEEMIGTTINIIFHNLFVKKYYYNNRYPLKLYSSGSHIHGELRIQIHGKTVPRMGYLGASDVCFGIWISELKAIRRSFCGNIKDKGHLAEEDGVRLPNRFDCGSKANEIQQHCFLVDHLIDCWADVVGVN